MAKAILIDAANKTVNEVESDGLQDKYNHIGCDMVECVDLGGGVDLWIDEEGRLKNAYVDIDGVKHNMFAFTFKGLNVLPYMGNGLIMGHDGMGETVDSPVSVEQVKQLVRFVEYENPADVPEPQMGFFSF